MCDTKFILKVWNSSNYLNVIIPIYSIIQTWEKNLMTTKSTSSPPTNKAIFLDRDGTINVDKHYLYRIEDFEFLPGVIDALKMLQDAGYLLIVVTNQSGIARGYYTEEDYKQLEKWMNNELLNHRIHIAGSYYCPHHPEAIVEKYRKDCDCRKPKLGMYMQAVQKFNLDLSKCYAIGDKIRDCHICELTECKGFLIGDNEEADIIKNIHQGKIGNIRYASDLLEATKEICNSSHR